mmetsp:Transcript_14688/g.26300  ORF Transcript_14688/g.26300 Transcript_14688/m.26300 type:complete len:119 (+) Transcript_14688:108-464(+)|eukprot:CAMPEP_0184508880 /NCGR_PEP_ID=MMETSP0198_2-20121128/989_1 /TAXON_ID=1112570 /ORGANISM="Thraustochytrium sp., Strain LLF1b" /LENGTH=118 /DNA_ID=CAMNT_0026898679 /DNA_START=194 /DNA_END=550 /DNA_ORIENTATION=+
MTDADVTSFDISNLTNKVDAFADAYQGSGTAQVDKVHIRLQQRNRRKCILTVTGLAEDLDLKRICKALKKNFKCNGAVVKDEEYGEVIQLQGDHRQGVVGFLVENEICPREIIIVHGH